MKRQIRANVFETNSSSTHSLVMVSKNEYEEWIKGNYVYDYYSDKLIQIDNLKEDEKKQIDKCDQYYSYNGFFKMCSSNGWETYKKNHTDPETNKTITAFGYYGYD